MTIVVGTWKDLLSRLPSEVGPPGWVGPTMFTLEARNGQLSAFRDGFRDHAHAADLVIGTSREPAAWPRLRGASDEAAHAWQQELLAELTAIDSAATSDADAYWPTSLETYTL